MKALKSITVAVSDPFRRNQMAIAKVGAIAAASGARLTLLNTFMLPQPMPEVAMGDSKQLIAATIRLRRRRLDELASKLRSKGIKVRSEVFWDYPPHEAIVRHVLEDKPDLLVFESHRHNRLVRLVLANTDWDLIRNCPCPVWFVRSPSLRKRPRFLVAVDPSHRHAKPTRLDDYLLQAAGTISKKLGATIDVAHAFLAPFEIVGGPGGPVAVPASKESVALHEKRIMKAVSTLVQRNAIDAEACHVQPGAPDAVLVDMAKKFKTDVLVMGAVSRSGLERLFIGSTAERVIDHVDCDVLVVKPAGYRTPVKRARPKVSSL
jgi:universal stress protein E